MAKKISGGKMRKKGITAAQKSARRKNIAVARQARKKGAKSGPDRLDRWDKKSLKKQLSSSKNKRQKARIKGILRREHW